MSPAQPNDKTLEQLRTVSIFAPLSDLEFNYLRPRFERSSAKSGDLVVVEQTEGDQLFVLIEGSVDVIAGYGTEEAKTLATLQAMDVFGVMALITGELRSATVVARETCSFVTLSRNSLESVLLAHPSVCLAILRDAYGKLRAINLRLQRLDQPQKTTKS